jgi:hypothetical protein
MLLEQYLTKNRRPPSWSVDRHRKFVQSVPEPSVTPQEQENSWLGSLFREALGGSTGTEFGEDVPRGVATFTGRSPLSAKFTQPVAMAPWSQTQAPSGYTMLRPKNKLFEAYKPWSLMG